MRKSKCTGIVVLLLVITLLLTGCASHVSLQAETPSGLVDQMFASVTFLVPEAALDEAVEYSVITNTEYPTIEERDAATVGLVQQAIIGHDDTRYLLTKSREFIFLVSEIGEPADFQSITREDMINLFHHSDLTFLYVGRGVTYLDKAVFQVTFSVADALGTRNTYSGYCAVTNAGDAWYGYLSGYKSASETQLKICFDCARSLA